MSKLYILLIMVLLTSCYNTKLAQRQVIKAQVNYPEVVAKHCASIYPPRIDTFERIEIKEGKVVTEVDTVVVDCDTVLIEKYKDRVVKVPIQVNKYRVDTILKEVVRNAENTARIKEIMGINEKQLREKELVIIGKDKEIKDISKKLNKTKGTNKVLWWIVAIVGLVVGIKMIIRYVIPKIF